MAAATVLAGFGCLSERSFRLRPADTRRVCPARLGVESGESARAWLQAAHGQLAELLPPSRAVPLLTQDLVDEAVDVFAHFGIRRERLQSLLGNMGGIRCSAQAAAEDYCIDQEAPPWPGFADVWIPIDEDLSLSGRLGYAREGKEGQVREADCIVILPGLFGDHGVQRTQDLAIYLRESGWHVLSLEVRGHGQTEAIYPDQCHTFGVLETDELMLVSDWLEEQASIRRTGLIGYCWGANIALLAGWYDGRPVDDASISPTLRTLLKARPEGRRFSAGIMAFSPIVKWEALADELDRPRSYVSEPVYVSVQNTIRDRAVRKCYPDTSGSLRNLIEFDYLGCDAALPGGVLEGYPFLRLLPHKSQPAFDKLEHVRVPVVIVHACNDPLSPAQDIGELMRTVDNPLVCALIMPGGGHVGFAAYCKEYYFSFIANFFDPLVGVAVANRGKDGAVSSGEGRQASGLWSKMVPLH